MPPSQFCPLVSDPATHSQLHPLSAPPTFSAMSWSSQPVLIWLLWKCSVSSSVTRNSTVVRKSPRIESSFNASTMFLGRGRGKAEKRATIILQASRAKGERGEGRGERGEREGVGTHRLAISRLSPQPKICPNCESANSCSPPVAATLKYPQTFLLLRKFSSCTVPLPGRKPWEGRKK